MAETVQEEKLIQSERVSEKNEHTYSDPTSPIFNAINKPKLRGTMRELVDQEHFILLQQSYCAYNKIKDRDLAKAEALREALKHLSASLSRK